MYTATVNWFYPDPEPFEEGVEDEIDPIETEARIGVNHCLGCGHEEFWLADPRSPLKAKVERLREALNHVEWTHPPYPAVCVPFCPWCGTAEADGHRADCMRQAALEPSP